MADTVLMVNASFDSELFSAVKTIVKKNKDIRFRFDTLPHIESMYKKDKLGRIFREKLLYLDKRLVCCFFNPLELETSLPLILEIMEAFDKTVLVCKKQEKIFFDSEKLSYLLGCDVFECEVNAESINGALDAIKANAMSLFYRSQSFINYGPDFSSAVGFIDYVIRDKYKIENPNWLSVRLLEGDRVLLREYSEYTGMDILKNKEVTKQVLIAKRYLYNFAENFDIPTYIEGVKQSLIDTISKSVITEEIQEFSFLTRESLLEGIFWVFVVGFALFGWFFIQHIN